MLGNLRGFVFAGEIQKYFGATDQEEAWLPSAPPPPSSPAGPQGQLTVFGQPFDPADWPSVLPDSTRGQIQVSPNFTNPKREDGRSLHQHYFYRTIINGDRQKIKRTWLSYYKKKKVISSSAFAASYSQRNVKINDRGTVKFDKYRQTSEKSQKQSRAHNAHGNLERF